MGPNDVQVNDNENPESNEQLDFEFARKHGLASLVYKNEEIAIATHNKCPCCNKTINGELLPLCSKLSELEHLGSGYPLYFKYIKYCIALLVLIFLTSGLYNMASSLVSSDCDDVGNPPFCVTNYITIFSIANKRNQKDLLKIEQGLNFLTVVLIVLFFHYIRYDIRKFEYRVDYRNITPSDYTARLRGVSTNAEDKSIAEWASIFINGDPEDIKVRRTWKLRKYVKLVKKKKKILDKLKNTIDSDEKLILQSEIDKKIEELDTEKKNFKLADVAFITFKRQEDLRKFLNAFKRSLLQKLWEYITPCWNSKYLIEGARVEVDRAPEPNDIQWVNIGYSDAKKYGRRVCTTVVTFIFVGAGFGILVLVNWGQVRTVKDLGTDSWLIPVLSILCSGIIHTINYILGHLVRWLSKLERHSTLTGYKTAVATKLAILFFFNSALIIMVAKLTLTGQVDSIYEIYSQLGSIQFFSPAGLIENMYYVVIFNSFLDPLLVLLDPGNMIRKYLIKKYEKMGEKSGITQAALKQLYEGPSFHIADRYALLIKNVLTTCFYASAIPIVIIFQILGLLLTYWADKYVFLRRASCPSNLDSDLTHEMIEYLEYLTLLFATGNVLFNYTIEKSNKESSTIEHPFLWIPLFISLWHIMFPMAIVNERIFKLKPPPQSAELYQDARVEHFFFDYDTQNPVTASQALKEFYLEKSKRALEIKKMNEGMKIFSLAVGNDKRKDKAIEESKPMELTDDSEKQGKSNMFQKNISKLKILEKMNFQLKETKELGDFLERYALGYKSTKKVPGEEELEAEDDDDDDDDDKEVLKKQKTTSDKNMNFLRSQTNFVNNLNLKNKSLDVSKGLGFDSVDSNFRKGNLTKTKTIDIDEEEEEEEKENENSHTERKKLSKFAVKVKSEVILNTEEFSEPTIIKLESLIEKDGLDILDFTSKPDE